jgi:hypothetical protein
MEGKQNQANDKQKVYEGTCHPVRNKSNHPNNNQNPRECQQHGVRSLSGASWNAVPASGKNSAASIVQNNLWQAFQPRVEFDIATLHEAPLRNCAEADSQPFGE